MSAPGGAREVAAMAWPMAIGMLSFTLMGVVDTLLMGFVSTAAQAGVGLALTLCFVCVAFLRGVVSGSQSLVAAAHGAGDEGRLRRAGGAGVLLGLVAGLVGTALVLGVMPAVLAWAAVDADVSAAALRYMKARAFGLPFTLVEVGLLAGLQGIGDVKARMWVSLAGNVVNAALAAVLVFGVGPFPALGEAGAGVATSVASALMAGLYGVRYARRLGAPRWPGARVLRDALGIGVPSGLQGLLNVLAFAAMNVALARAGPVHLAASEIVINVASLSFLPGFGVGEAAGVLVARHLGAGAPGVAGATVRSARLLALAIMGTCGLLFATQGARIAGWFTQDAEVAALAGTLMAFAASFQVLDAMATVHLCALRGAGDTRFTLALTTACAWGLTVPATLGLGLGLGWGATGAWLGLTLEIGVLAAVTGWRVAGIAGGRVGRLDLLLGEGREARPSPAAAVAEPAACA